MGSTSSASITPNRDILRKIEYQLYILKLDLMVDDTKEIFKITTDVKREVMQEVIHTAMDFFDDFKEYFKYKKKGK